MSNDISIGITKEYIKLIKRHTKDMQKKSKYQCSSTREERDRTAIGRHISDIFTEGELDKNMVCANYAHTTQHGAIEENIHLS